jgi:CRP-like cAMP-binding protein
MKPQVATSDSLRTAQLAVTRKLQLRDSSLGETSIHRLLGAMGTPRHVSAGGEFVVQGSRPGHSTVLLTGWAARFGTLLDGRRQTLALHMPGDFVDLHSFPLKVMDHGVEAITSCLIAEVPHARLMEITMEDPHLTRVLWLSTLIDAAILRQWLMSAAQRSAIEHTAHLLCELFMRLQTVGLAAPGRSFMLPLSQSQLGAALGISSVHVSRTLTELRKIGLVAWQPGEVRILDWDGLQRLAQFDPTYLSQTDEPR